MLEQKGASTILRASVILRCITEGITQSSVIADTLGLSRSTTHRLLKTLQSAGFVFQDPLTLRFSLGPFISFLVDYSNSYHQILVFCALPEMEKLRRTTGETIALVIHSGLRRMHLEELPSPQPLKYAGGKGFIAPLYAGATGKILLSQMPPQEMVRLLDSLRLERVGPNTITDRPTLLEELEKVRRDRHAISFGEIVPGSACIAVPIEQYSQPVAMCVLGPESRMSGQIDKMLSQLRRTASVVQRRLQVMMPSTQYLDFSSPVQPDRPKTL